MEQILTTMIASLALTILVPIPISPNNLSQYEKNILSVPLVSNHIIFIDDDNSDGKIVYEQKSGGFTYKITEYIENNFEKVTSIIEIRQDKNTYETISKNISIRTNTGIEMYCYDYISTQFERFEINFINDEYETSSLAENTRANNILLRNSTGWVYDGTTYGSNKFIKLTLSFVTQVIIGIASPGGTVVSNVVSTVAGSIAQTIINRLIPTVYYARAYYEKRSLDVSWPMVTGSKWVTRFYSNSNRTDYLGTTTEVVDQS